MNTTEILALARDILKDYNLTSWSVAWDDGKRRAGACHYHTRTISLSRHIIPKASDEEIRETILHEVAHALTPGHSHDHVWRRQLIAMGGTGARTHTMETPKGRYEMHCANCGLVGHRHQAQGAWKVTVGRPGAGWYTHRKCGGAMWLVDTKAPRALPTHSDTPTAVQIPVAARKPSVTPPKAGGRIGGGGTACRCLCGGTTKGGKYLPGHDARHASRLQDEVRTGVKTRAEVEGILSDSPNLLAKVAKRMGWL